MSDLRQASYVLAADGNIFRRDAHDEYTLWVHWGWDEVFPRLYTYEMVEAVAKCTNPEEGE